MKSVSVVLFFVFVVMAASNVNAQSALDEASQKQMVMTNLSSMPLAFTENRGQWGEKTLFKAEAGGATFYFCSDEVAYLFTRDTDELLEDELFPGQGIPGMEDKFSKPRYKKEALLIKAQFVGSNPNPEVIGEDRLAHNCNYFYGNEPDKWRTDVPNYSSITYKDIWPGIDLKYHGNGKSMKYDFIVNPGADISQIRIRYEGVDDLAISNAGDLEAQTRFGLVYENIPEIYQEINGVNVHVSGSYRLIEPSVFGFAVEGYNPSLAVVIDPELVYSTYLGGDEEDLGLGIAVDVTGNAYVTGSTNSINFPAINAFDANHNGSTDVFIVKISALGNYLMHSTYLGGSGGDYGCRIAVDVSGIAYVTGLTQSFDFPVINACDSSLGLGAADVFVAKLSTTGNSLLFSTYFGGDEEDNWEWVYGFAVDETGNAYIAGQTGSLDLPVINAFDSSFNGVWDGFAAKISTTGDCILYCTYLGGNIHDWAFGIAIDSLGNAYVTGGTISTDFPITNAFDGSHNGGQDVFILKLSSAGNSLLYSTYLGGSGSEGGWGGIAVDDSGYAYVTGFTESSDFPTVNAYDPIYNGSTDFFVAKLSYSGNSLLYSTYLGGSEPDTANGIAVDGSGAAYVVGHTYSTDFPTVDPYDGIYNGSKDIIVAKLSPSGHSLIYSTYLGGSADDHLYGISTGNAIAVDIAGNAYVTGSTASSDFPTRCPYDDSLGGTWDAFVTKFGIPQPCCLLYLPGDVNMSEGNWPPAAISPDVTYLVNFFRGLPTSQSCPLDGFWCSADANGDCSIISSDVTKLVNVFRGLTTVSHCPDYPPAWPTPADLPAEEPSGWPNCE